MNEERLDQAIVRAGLARSRTAAQQLIRDSAVRVNSEVVTKASHKVSPADEVVVRTDPWVSRAAHKLLGALDDFSIEVPATALDAGASTGGFTQVLLSRGAELVHAFDVGHDQLAPELRLDPRVHAVEGFNLRNLTLDDLGGRPVDLVVADVSFISLTLLVEPLLGVLSHRGLALLMVKPQFEVGRKALGAGGVVRDEATRLRVVREVGDHVRAAGWKVADQVPSRLPGPAGNIEYFLLCKRADPAT